MHSKKLSGCLLLWLMALAGCQSAPVVQPQQVACPPPPAPAAWMMEASAPTFTKRMLDVLSASPETPTPAP